MTGRTFATSLKPAWTEDRILLFCNNMIGTAKVFVINHNRDIDPDTKEPIEDHTHFLLEYDTPRKITTVANVFDVEPNFIELVRNKKGMMRYLTHMDDPDKAQYQPYEVITNSPVPYADIIKGQGLSDKEIAQYIDEGRGLELLDIVNPTKLRTIQTFIHFNRTKAIQKNTDTMVENQGRMISELLTIKKAMTNIDEIAQEFKEGLLTTGTAMKEGLERIANEIANYKRLMKR